jgi:membrane associated rhomboid family serine protease
MQQGWEDPPPERGTGGFQFAMPALTPVVKKLIIANVALFVLTFLLPVNAASWVLNVFGLQPALWREWFPLVPFWQLASYGFLHDLHSLFHVLMNMLFLYFLGTMLEGIVGSRRFFVAFMSALVIAGIVTAGLGLIANETRPTIGASGGVLAVVVATACLRPQTRVIFLLFPITLKTLAWIYVAVDLFGVLSALKGVDTGVANLAHLTGAGWGYLLVKRGWIWRDPMQELETRRETQVREREVADEERIDQLLDKINREGIHSLSNREKAFLKRASKRR